MHKGNRIQSEGDVLLIITLLIEIYSSKEKSFIDLIIANHVPKLRAVIIIRKINAIKYISFRFMRVVMGF